MPNINTQTNEPQLPEVHVTPKGHASLELEDILEPVNPQDSVEFVSPQASPKPVAPVDAQASSKLIILPEAPTPFVLPCWTRRKTN